MKTTFSGFPLHLHLALAHCVLPPPGRDHPPHLPGRAFIRKISSIHHDPRYLQVEAGSMTEDNYQLLFQYMCHNCCPQYSFSLSSDAHYGSLDQANILMNNNQPTTLRNNNNFLILHFRHLLFMENWSFRRVFIHILPRLLVMKRPGAHKQM